MTRQAMLMPAREAGSVAMISDGSPSAYLRGVSYRGFIIKQAMEHFLFEIQADKEPVPHTLSGRYTTIALVQKCIDEYLEKKQKDEQEKDTDTSHD